MKNIILSEELNNMKYLLGYKRGLVISEQAATTSAPAATTSAPAATTPAPAATTPAPTNTVDLIKQIQTILKTKYKVNLGTTGPNKDGVDGSWGKNTQAGLETALKSIASTTTNTAPAQGTTTTNTVPAQGTTNTAAAPATAAPAQQFKAAELPKDIGFKPSTPALK